VPPRRRAARIGDPTDLALLATITRGEFAIAGFRYRDLRPLLHPSKRPLSATRSVMPLATWLQAVVCWRSCGVRPAFPARSHALHRAVVYACRLRRRQHVPLGGARVDPLARMRALVRSDAQRGRRDVGAYRAHLRPAMHHEVGTRFWMSALSGSVGSALSAPSSLTTLTKRSLSSISSTVNLADQLPDLMGKNKCGPLKCAVFMTFGLLVNG
jgi:hypothetical protein